MRTGLSLRAVTAAAIAYALAMAYVESAVVVYLQTALGGQVGVLFPLRPAAGASARIAIEAGREAATLVMIAAVGALAGRSPLERLAWGAVVFGVWDIAYYGWLWVFSGWPSSPAALDVLFLLPVPWVGPVWSPVAVSVALAGVGLIVARRLRRGEALPLGRRHWLAGVGGGLLVVLSWTLGVGQLLDAGYPGPYPWPVFALGMAIALAAAAAALRRPATRDAAA